MKKKLSLLLAAQKVQIPQLEVFLNYNKNKKHIITTKIEHPCVLNVYKYLEKQGYKVDYIGVNSNGELNLKN